MSSDTINKSPFVTSPMKIVVGAEKPRDGWHTVNINDRHKPDTIADVLNLPFDDESVEQIYMSHVLEHFHYRMDHGVADVLRELFRVLQPGGLVQIGVPDMDVLAELYLQLSGHDRIHIMRCIMGGQVDERDVHLVAFDKELLSSFLTYAGFEDIRQVESFGVFPDDCTDMILFGRKISLNMEARKPCST